MLTRHTRLPHRWQKLLLAAILIAAMVLRIVAAAVNTEANDNHVDVVSYIVDNHALPEKDDCWSCYQPKLYYLICAVPVKWLHVQGYTNRVKTMQAVSVVFAFLLLLVIQAFIQMLPLHGTARVVLFALVAFNPSLWGINIQGTNDTAAIFFGALSIYAAYRWWATGYRRWLAVMLAGIIAGCVTKASVLIIAMVIAIAMAGAVVFGPAALRKKNVVYLLIYLAVVLSTVPFLGGYYHNYQKYGSYTLSTWQKDPPARFFQQTSIGYRRYGVRSMYDAFFTFRLGNMLRQPYINNEMYGYPQHRCSLWSQLYGRMVFLQFDQWPPSWQGTSAEVVLMGRASLLLGLVPLLLFLLGLAAAVIHSTRKLAQLNFGYFGQPLNYLGLALTLAALASSVYYSYNYRDFSSMKTIYIMPMLPAFIYLIARGMQLVKVPALRTVVYALITAFVLLNITTQIYLTCRLAAF